MEKRGKKLEVFTVNTKVKLASLWVVLMLLYIYADILSLFRPGYIEKISSGYMGPFPVTQTAILVAAILMIIPSLMVFLSLSLSSPICRWFNIIAGVLYTLVGIGNLAGETWIYYIVYGIIEMIVTVFIIYTAWKWPLEREDSK